MRPVHPISSAILILVALALGACGSAPTRIYALSSVPPTARSNSPSSMMRVDSVHLPAGWDRIEILSPSGPGELKINDFDRWSAPLAQATRQILSADLDLRLPPGSVIYPHLAKSSNALGISVEILQFTITGSEGSLQASWIITPSQAPDSAKRGFATVTVTMTGTEPAAIARAWSALLGQVADRVVVDTAAFPVL